MFVKSSQDGSGFTLLELLVTIFIFTLIVVIAIPYFSGLFKAYEAQSVANQIRQMAKQNRVVARTQHAHVVFCPTDDSVTCNRFAESYLMSFIDANANQQRDSAEQILQRLNLNLRHGYVRFKVGASRHYMRYFPDTGKPRGYAGNLQYCTKDNNAKFAKQVIISMQGTARVSHDRNANGIDEDSHGRELRCK